MLHYQLPGQKFCHLSWLTSQLWLLLIILQFHQTLRNLLAQYFWNILALLFLFHPTQLKNHIPHFPTVLHLNLYIWAYFTIEIKFCLSKYFFINSPNLIKPIFLKIWSILMQELFFLNFHLVKIFNDLRFLYPSSLFL